jgi:hypothetical protein
VRAWTGLEIMTETLFLNSDAVFQDVSDPTHTTGTVQSLFEEHEVEIKQKFHKESIQL